MYSFAVSQEQELLEGVITDKLKELADKYTPVFIKKLKSAKPNQYKKYINIKKKELKDSDINIKKIESISKKHAKNAIKSSSKSDTKNGQSIFTYHLKDMFSEMKKEGIFKSSVKGLLITIVCVSINTFFYALLSMLFTPAIALAITAILIGPINEEFWKFVSIKSKATASHIIFFNIIEFINYVVLMLVGGIALPIAIAIRLLCVFFHVCMTIYQREIIQTGGKDSWKKTAKLHVLWNLFASVGKFGFAPLLLFFIPIFDKKKTPEKTRV
jgi:hypothetical protein